ncbi:BTAD domain-containing putative transcriptional regulator [Streptomyces olivaceoviridis]|uniref:BTAD domain-containing putative transcriptional regulator n=1 Tax=Streptomyces olivaceoviridis TaxID=1921 RepID=A0ABW7VH36_STROI
MLGQHAEDRLRFNVLGPLEVWAGETRLRLGGLVQERVLATLLLEPGRLVPVSRLVEAAWEEEPPATASHQVRKAVADLRRRIPGGSQVVLTDGPGYRVAVLEDQLDLTEFTVLVRRARAAAEQDHAAQAVEALRTALELWRGPVLSDVAGPVISAAAAALDERRLAAAEQLFELCLGLGQAAELVADLRDLTAKYPLRENLRRQLMLALYRSSRQAEALEEYARVRDLLVEELGIDPGQQLTQVYEGILRESPDLAAPEPPASPAPAAPAPAQAPCTLPCDLADFSGRDREQRELLDCAQRSVTSAPGIVAIDGMGGCGKTALAVRVAHRLADDYPDGRLYINLRGYTPGEQPVTSAAALATLLRALGVPGDQIPDDLEGRTAAWRAALTGRRLLLLLDNAVDAADVRLLMPPSPGCLVLVTSRSRLLDLDGAHWTSLDVMSGDDSVLLVSKTLGAERVAAEPEASAELARLCGHLPLALRIATARLRNRPRWTVGYLVDRLCDETRRLDELSLGERSVAATLRLSYQTMAAESRVAFRLLALHPGSDIDVHSAAALLGTDTRDAEDILEHMLDVHLLQQPDVGLYAFHDLVRSFALSLRGPATEEEDHAAVGRLLAYYLTATERACDVLFPGRRRRPTGLPATGAELPDLGDAHRALTWFTREHTALSGAVALARTHGHDRHAVWLTRDVVFYLNARGHISEFRDLSRSAVEVARRLGDLVLLAVSLSNLGVACWKLGRFEEGVEVAREALEVATELGDRDTEAHSESTLGLLNSVLGRFDEALPHLVRAVDLGRELGNARSESESLTILSTLYEQWGRYPEAAEAARRAVELDRRLGNRENEIVSVTDLALALLGLKEYTEAQQCLERARRIGDQTHDPGNVGVLLALSADVQHRLGDTADAARLADQALELVRSSVVPIRQVKTENILGRLCTRQGDPAKALHLHTSALKTASGIGYRIEEAHALAGLARACEALGDHAAARQHAGAAAGLFDTMGVPEIGRSR